MSQIEKARSLFRGCEDGADFLFCKSFDKIRIGSSGVQLVENHDDGYLAIGQLREELLLQGSPSIPARLGDKYGQIGSLHHLSRLPDTQ